MADIDYSELCGCVLDPVEARAFRETLNIQSYNALPRESGRGKKRFLWTYQRQVMGKDFEEIQTIGDCVGKGIQRAVLLLYCIRIALQGLMEKVPGIPASEVPYALGRHEIGRDKLGKKDGCVISWAIKGVTDYGLLFRKPYGNIDLTTYSGKRARDWGAPGNGLPNELEPLTKLFPLKEAAPITSWSEGCDALYNGEPLIIGSNSIFTRRASDGYLSLTQNGGHCTIFDGYDDTAQKPYWSYNNASWPAMAGATVADCPRCSGPITRKQVERMLSEGECYALSDIQGMPGQSDDLNMFEMI